MSQSFNSLFLGYQNDIFHIFLVWENCWDPKMGRNMGNSFGLLQDANWFDISFLRFFLGSELKYIVQIQLETWPQKTPKHPPQKKQLKTSPLLSCKTGVTKGISRSSNTPVSTRPPLSRDTLWGWGFCSDESHGKQLGKRGDLLPHLPWFF